MLPIIPYIAAIEFRGDFQACHANDDIDIAMEIVRQPLVTMNQHESLSIIKCYQWLLIVINGYKSHGNSNEIVSESYCYRQKRYLSDIFYGMVT